MVGNYDEQGGRETVGVLAHGRGGSLWGVVLGVAAALAIILWQWWRERASREPSPQAVRPAEVATGESEPGGTAPPPAAAAPREAPEEAGVDDLKAIDGIGPKIEALLHQAGIRTYAQLAETPVERLREILAQAGPRFRLADPTTWPEQARRLAEKAGST